MKIETLDEWQQVSDCCCGITDISVVLSYNVEYKSRTQTACFYTKRTNMAGGSEYGFYRRFVDTVNATNYISGLTYYYEQVRDERWNGTICDRNDSLTTTGTLDIPPLLPSYTTSYDVSYTGTPPGVHTKTEVYKIFNSSGDLLYINTDVSAYSDGYVDLKGELKDEALTVLDVTAWSSGGSLQSSCAYSSLTTLPRVSATLRRFRWSIPDSFTGVYFKVTWDVLDQPTGWDAPSPTVFRSFFAQDLTWEWTGPGDPMNPDSWKSGFYEIDLPDFDGVRKIVNIRYEFFRSTKFGVKPLTIGEAVSPDEL